MIETHLKKSIREIEDFPTKGISFKDITPVLGNHKLREQVIEEIVNQFKKEKIDVVVGIESRGFYFGVLIAQALKVPFIPIRKQGKLPGDKIAYSFSLEYGSATVEMQKGSLKKDQRVLIHDDILATGGTASAASELVLSSKARIAGYSFIIDLSFLEGRGLLASYSSNIHSLATY